MALLEVKNLKKYFKTSHGMLHAVDDISFTLEKGKTLYAEPSDQDQKQRKNKVVIHAAKSLTWNER